MICFSQDVLCIIITNILPAVFGQIPKPCQSGIKEFNSNEGQTIYLKIV